MMKFTKTVLASAVLSACALTVTTASANIATSTSSFGATLGSGTYNFGSQWSASNPMPSITTATLNFQVATIVNSSMLVSTTPFTPLAYSGPIWPNNYMWGSPPNPNLRPNGTPWPFYADLYKRSATENYYNSQVMASASVGNTTTNVPNSLLSTPKLVDVPSSTLGGLDWVFLYHVVTNPDGPIGQRNNGPLPNYAIDYDVYQLNASLVDHLLSGYSNVIDISIPLDSVTLDTLNTTGNVSYSLSTNGSNYFVNNASLAYSYNYTPTTSTVPLPAGAYLLGSGLIGLIGVARKKTQA